MNFPPAPFSWSKRRQRLWEFCRFGYYLHYYGASGGFDPDAPPHLRLIHELKSLRSAHEYLLQIIADAVRRRFFGPEDAPEDGALYPELRRRFRSDCGRMFAGYSRRDHGIPMLTELYYDAEHPTRLARRLEAELREACVKLETELLPALRAVGGGRRLPLPSPLPVQINDLVCHIAPWIALADGGTLCFIDAAGDDTTVLLHRYCALNRYHTPPDRVRSLQYLPLSGALREVGMELNIGVTVRRLLDNAQTMRNALRPDGSAAPEDFPRNEANCRECRFRRFCETGENP